MSLNTHLDFSLEVQHALANGRPLVALESTIISHGMPYPQNVATALQVEAQVRAHGAVPATIAIVDGRLKTGLSATEIENLGKRGRDAIKVSRRDIPFIVAAGQTGATTVASTMKALESSTTRFDAARCRYRRCTRGVPELGVRRAANRKTPGRRARTGAANRRQR